MTIIIRRKQGVGVPRGLIGKIEKVRCFALIFKGRLPSAGSVKPCGLHKRCRGKLQRKVSIPAGIDHGQSVRLRGKGEPGKNGGARGDLLVEVYVERHKDFQRMDYDIYSTVRISYPRAVLGGDVVIPTIDGDVAYNVKAGTQTGTRVRLRGKGVPSLRNRKMRGNHYVDLVVDVPTKLTKEQKKLLEQLDKSFEDEENKKNKKHKK